MWKIFTTIIFMVILTACNPPSEANRPGDGTVVIKMNDIGVDVVQFRHLASVNAVRNTYGLSTLSLDTSLIRAAQLHASDMSAWSN